MLDEDTKFGDIRVGDVVPFGPHGEYVVGVKRRGATDGGERSVVSLTTVYFVEENTRERVPKGHPNSSPRLGGYGWEWTHETIRQSRARAEYMASVPD